jgi:hypothetical protein
VALGRTLRAGALVVAAAICATSGCGLPDDRPVLPPPTDPESSATAQQFTFKVSESTAPRTRFLGIELYYRIVGVDSVSGRDLESREELVAGGFRRIASSTDDDPPSLPLIDGPGAGTVITLDFSGADIGEDPVATWDGGERRVSLRRAVRSGTDDYKRFACDEFDPGDVDITTVTEELADPNDCEVVQLRLYALSYGATDPDGFTVYSEALDLHSITLTFGRR